jgi:hypothetical protein
MPHYQLVNPYIKGKFNTKIKSKSSETAADEAWSKLSKFTSINVPNFSFTLKRIEDNKLYHFNVKEKLKKNDSVSYTIDKLNSNLSTDETDNFITHINNLETKLDGGRKSSNKHKKSKKHSKSHDDSSSSSSDSDSDSDSDDLLSRVKHFKNKSQPVNYLWYSPILYKTDDKINNFYLPTFTISGAPYYNYIAFTI